MGFSVRVGTHVDLFMSASGCVLLACQEAAVTSQRLLEYGTDKLLETPEKAVSTILERVRREGFAEMESFQVRGVHGMSYAVRDFHGHATAALTVPYLERLDDPRRKTVDDAREALKAASEALTAATGGRREHSD